MKKALSFMLAMVFILISAAACSSTGVSDTTTAAPAVVTEAPAETTAEPTAFELLEPQDYGQYVFKIHYPGVDKCYTDFYAENITGEVLNDAIFQRNAAVCNKYNIGMTIDWKNNNDPVTEEVKLQFTSGDQTYDMFGGHRNCLSLSYQGFLYDLASLDSLCLDKIWWDQNWVDSMTVNGSLYFAAGDISVDTLLYVSSLTFNKKLLSDYQIEYPYELARSGKWTYEELYKMTAEYGQDVNADSKMTPGTDIYSIVGWHYESAYSLFYGSGITFMNRDGDGKYMIEFDADRLENIMSEVYKVWSSPCAYMRFTSGDPEHEGLYKIFADGQSMFSDIVLAKIGWFYNDMADDFGIVPIPKFTADQETYHSYTGYTIPITCFCRNAENPERTGTIIEAFARASYDMVTPQMYEIVTKSKNVRDADSAEMIELVYRNKIFDAAHYFNLPTFGTLPSAQLQGGNVGLASLLKTGSKVAEKELKKITDAYDAMNK